MTLESQVCSLELAKQLKELGVKQESLFWWGNGRSYLWMGRAMVSIEEEVVQKKSVFPDDFEWYSAFTVAELGEMLPWTLWNENKTNYWNLVCHGGLTTGFRVGYWRTFRNVHMFFDAPLAEFDEKTEADARALLLVHLLKAGHVKM